MSAEEQGGAGRREVAYRLFAAEFDDADFEYSEDEDERSPNYVITPTGARVNRLFVVGVLTEVEPVNEDMLRARVVDPTGAFVIYAGQYQPDALAFLERADPPQFVSVTGKARTFEPDDADVIYTSIRPETMNAVDAETRDRWTVQTARHTLDRIATLGDALEREERGDDLRATLEAEGEDTGLASGIALAIDHYGTTTGYLDALRDLAVQAGEVVAGEREEVESLDVAPDEGGEADLEVDRGVIGSATESSATLEETGTTTTASADEADSGDEPDVVETESEGEAVEAETDETVEPSGDSDTDDLGDFDSFGEEAEAAETESGAGDTESEAAEAEPEEAIATDEMYEMDEEERQEIEEEFGTEFTTGSEVEGADESAAGATDSEESGPSDDSEADEEPAEDETTADDETSDEDAADAEAEAGEDVSAEEVDEEEDEETDEMEPEEAPEDVDLEDAVMDTMEELDEGNGADRDVLIERVSDEYGVGPDEVEDAIQEALMSGKCYEPGDDKLKAI